MRDDYERSIRPRKEKSLATEAPLAARMRPRTLEEYVGLENILGDGKQREVVGDAVERRRLYKLRTILFVDRVLGAQVIFT